MLEHVTVVVTDSPALMEFPDLRAARWSLAEKGELAEEIRLKLLDAEGAAGLRAEVDAKKLELEGMRLDKRVEKKARMASVGREVIINRHLEQQVGGNECQA